MLRLSFEKIEGSFLFCPVQDLVMSYKLLLTTVINSTTGYTVSFFTIAIITSLDTLAIFEALLLTLSPFDIAYSTVHLSVRTDKEALKVSSSVKSK